MELKALLKLEKKFMRHCDFALKNCKVFYWMREFKKENVDLTDVDNEDLVERIKLRNQISSINKQINHYLVLRLKKFNIDIKPYIKNYWNEIIEGFACTKNKYKTEDSFQKTFLHNQDSPLYRRFPDCLTAQSMRHYIIYLKYYLEQLKQCGHNEAIVCTIQEFKDDKRIRAEYQEPALPTNWSDIYKQIVQLEQRAKLISDDVENE